jgi:hypothetical protein
LQQVVSGESSLELEDGFSTAELLPSVIGSGAVLEDESSPQASSANESAAVIGAATIPVKIFAFFI